MRSESHKKRQPRPPAPEPLPKPRDPMSAKRTKGQRVATEFLRRTDWAGPINRVGSGKPGRLSFICYPNAPAQHLARNNGGVNTYAADNARRVKEEISAATGIRSTEIAASTFMGAITDD